MIKGALKFGNLLSGIYTVYLIGKEIYPYVGEFNMGILEQHLASIVVVLIFVGSGGILLYGWYTKNLKRRPIVHIITPQDDDKVHRETLAKGIAEIPGNRHLWLLIHRKGQRWYPQGVANVIEGGWETRVTFGSIGTTGMFELAAVMVDKQVNEDLKKWLDNARATGWKGSNPIDLPNAIAGCPVKTISVEKIGD